MAEKNTNDLLWKNISTLPYFRGFLRAVEGDFYQNIHLEHPIMDLGIGDGHFNSATFASMVDVGVDPSLASLTESTRNSGSLIRICSTGASLPFPENYFASGFSNSVLEHIPNLSPVLQEIRRVLKPKATFVMSVPNDNFTKNLSLARGFRSLGFPRLAKKYQEFFNFISRHHHPDPHEVWEKRFHDAGFDIIESWRYFSKRSLQILEWGHFFGIPSWIAKKIFGRWVLFPYWWNLGGLYQWLWPHWSKNQKCDDGAYSFFVCRNR